MHVTTREFWATSRLAVSVITKYYYDLEVDTSTTLYGDELCVVIDLDT